MISRRLGNSAGDLALIHVLLQQSESADSLGDFEEAIQLPTVQATVRLWEDGGLLGAAYVDDYSNLWFVIRPEAALVDTLAAEMVQWGLACVQVRNSDGEAGATLDCVCEAQDTDRIRLLKTNGFIRQDVRTLKYERRLEQPVAPIKLPDGYDIRCAAGEAEVDTLTELHRAAFETDQMMAEYRLVMMCAPGYRADLDMVVTAPDGCLAAFCVGGVEEDRAGWLGKTDPIGTHPDHRRKGLAQAVVSEVLRRLQAEGIRRVALGTSSDNLAMQRLADSLEFKIVSEKVWLSKPV